MLVHDNIWYRFDCEKDMIKKTQVFALILLLSGCEKKPALPKDPLFSMSSAETKIEEPNKQPEYLSRKSDEEQEESLPPASGLDQPRAIPTLPIGPPRPLATDDDLAPPLNLPGPALFPYARCGNGGPLPDGRPRPPEGVEQCDLGTDNLTNNKGCNIICEFPYCGNGVTENNGTKILEECDDGNNINGDGCSARCLFERCGNARIDPGEECDDGNFVNGDKCSACCTFEKCGNKVFDFEEQCDDGNMTKGDGCDDCCKLETAATQRGRS